MTPPGLIFFKLPTASFPQKAGIILMKKFIPRLPRLRHDTPGWVENPEFFITLTCKPRGTNQLCHPLVAKVIFESALHRQLKKIWRWELLVLMPDHLHGILSIPDHSDLAKALGDWKRWISAATKIRFQEGFFDHRLRGIASAAEKWSYVNENPVRARLVHDPEQWPFRWTTDDFSSQAASSRPPYLG